MVYKIVVALHVFAAVIWAGGVLFMGMIAVPLAARQAPELRRRLLTDLGTRFRTVGWSALGVLLATGTYMVWHRGARIATILDGSFFAAPHMSLLAGKLVLVFVMLCVSAVHDFYLGPRAARDGLDAHTAERYRKAASWLGRATGLATIVIVLLAVFVARPWLLV